MIASVRGRVAAIHLKNVDGALRSRVEATTGPADTARRALKDLRIEWTGADRAVRPCLIFQHSGRPHGAALGRMAGARQAVEWRQVRARPRPDGSSAGAATTRMNAVTPTAIAPMTEKTICHVSDGIVCFTIPWVA